MTVASHGEFELSSLREILTSNKVNEIVVNPDGSVWVEYSDEPYMSVEQYSIVGHRLLDLAYSISAETGNVISSTNPIVSGNIMLFGCNLRAQIMIPPAVESGISLTLRKHAVRILPVESIKYLASSQVGSDEKRLENLQQARQLVRERDLPAFFRHIVDARFNVIISGGTSSGKTSVVRSLLCLVAPEERLVLIEDAAELNLPSPNKVVLLSDRRTGSQRAPEKLLESSLRMRPDRIIVGEVRGQEALNFLEAVNTGHPGSLCTLHANSPRMAIERLAFLASRGGSRDSREEILSYIKSTIDVIVQVGRDAGARGVQDILILNDLE
jgi:type IV secretion system protein VirB11